MYIIRRADIFLRPPCRPFRTKRLRSQCKYVILMRGTTRDVIGSLLTLFLGLEGSVKELMLFLRI